ncbi:MAG TPA: hypothetical protein VF283_18460, partial [Bryobacteraceae bacterium]
MSTLTVIDRRYLEKFLMMGDGYVLRYSDKSFGAFFNRHSIDIHGPKYQTIGTSKANKLRAFWDIENDSVVGKVMSGMVDEYVVDCELNNKDVDATLLEKVRSIISRLNGKQSAAATPTQTADDFLNHEFTIPNIHKLPVEALVIPIIESRLAEARIALGAKAHLSVIFLCGSVLEAVLLGAAQKEPARFNKATASPKDASGGVKRFHEWSLAQFIDVACEVDLLKPDVKKFSHGLRDFRNYIHPYEQMQSGFTPDEHTA